MARLHPDIRSAAEKFVLLRITNMRGVDLSLFDFDYDLSWHAFFLTSDGIVLGRFGGRDVDTPGKYQTLVGLRHSLERASVRFESIKDRTLDVERKPSYAENYPAAAKLPPNACIHCHHVHEFRRDALQRDKRWSLEDVWVYPQPENIGLTLDADRGDRVLAVKPKSPAAALGIKAKDLVRQIGNIPIASVADVQYALHLTRADELLISWHSGSTENKVPVKLPKDWRKTDVSWRWSLTSMSPNPSIIGDDLNPEERTRLGLGSRQLAYRQMNFLTPTARHAGLHANDVIIGLNDQPLTMTARQFETHIRLYCQVGQEITLNVVRGTERIKVKMKLPE